jgi:hypothetical protein
VKQTNSFQGAAAAGSGQLGLRWTRRDQGDRLLELFEAHRCTCPLERIADGKHCDHCVPLPRILALQIAQYNTRISELRKAGHDIKNLTEWSGRVRHSWFRYRGKI